MLNRVAKGWKMLNKIPEAVKGNFSLGIMVIFNDENRKYNLIKDYIFAGLNQY